MPLQLAFLHPLPKATVAEGTSDISWAVLATARKSQRPAEFCFSRILPRPTAIAQLGTQIDTVRTAIDRPNRGPEIIQLRPKLLRRELIFASKYPIPGSV